LNGGGPEGPKGPIGPPGPVGGRGIRGSQWYEDPFASPGTNPNTLIFIDLLEGDSYLQSDGTVWEYNGTVWIVTAVNLTGPQGPSGLSAGLGYFGQISINNENTLYPTVMPNGISGGANPVNEGVPAVMIGGVVSNTTQVPTIPFTNAYQIDNNIAQSIGSEITSLFIHQKDSSTKSITFHGGGALPSDKFEQNIIGNLSNITLGIDDRLVINVPKIPTTPTNTSDLIGLEFITTAKGQVAYSGKAIEHYTGLSTTNYLLGEYSDYRIVVNQSNSSVPPKFSVNITTPRSSLQLGGGITFPGTPNIPITGGNFLLNTVNAQILTSGTNLIRSAGVITIQSNTSNVDTVAPGNISHTSANLINTTTSGISNNVTGNGNITHTIFNGAFSSTSSAGAGNVTNTPANSVGWSYLYARNGIDLNANAAGSQIIAVSQGSLLLRSVDQNTTIESLTTNVQINAAQTIGLTGSRINIQATGATSGSGGRIDLNTSFDNINITSAKDVNILTGGTGATGTFDLGAGTIDMFSNLNTTINAGGATSILRLLSGNNIELTATSGVNGLIDINSRNLDIDASILITIDAPLLNIGSAGTNLVTNISAVGSISLTSNIMSLTTNSARQLNPGSGPGQTYNSPFNVNSWISPTFGSAIYNVTSQNPAFASGLYLSPSGVNTPTYKQFWIKTGSIVQVTGFVEFPTSGTNASTAIIHIPCFDPLFPITSGSDNFYGHGTWYDSLTNQEMYAVELQLYSVANYFFIRRLPAIGGTNITTTGSNTNMINRGFARFSYTYTTDY
jgi:hypothetical protein